MGAMIRWLGENTWKLYRAIGALLIIFGGLAVSLEAYAEAAAWAAGSAAFTARAILERMDQ